MLVDEEACPRRLGTRALAWGQPLVVVVVHSRAHVVKHFEGLLRQASLHQPAFSVQFNAGMGARRQRAAVEYVVERGGHDAGCDGGNRIVSLLRM